MIIRGWGKDSFILLGSLESKNIGIFDFCLRVRKRAKDNGPDELDKREPNSF
jgi:hypothetical protein